MKIKILLIFIIFILISSVYSLEPGKLYINDVFIPFETKEKVEEPEKVKSTFYIYANNQRIAKKENNKLYYFYNDHLGSSRAISDDQGNIVWKADYKPFGEVFNELNFDNKINYNSKELDLDTKLHYYGQRYYPSNIGRFITADIVKPDINIPQSLNKYVYTLNNPLKYIDPIGHQQIDSLKLFIQTAQQQQNLDLVRQMLRGFFTSREVENMFNYILKPTTLGDRITTIDTLMFTADSLLSSLYFKKLKEKEVEGKFIYPDSAIVDLWKMESDLDTKLTSFHEQVHKFYLTGTKSREDYLTYIKIEELQKIDPKEAIKLFSIPRIRKEYYNQLIDLEGKTYDMQIDLIYSMLVYKKIDLKEYNQYKNAYERRKKYELDKLKDKKDLIK